MPRKLAITVAALLLLASTVAVVWSGLNLPPPLWLVKYGLHPGCEPTGEVIEVQDIKFVVIGPGCFRMGSSAGGDPGALVRRLCGPAGIEWGESPEPSDEMPVHWVEFPAGFALARTEITNAQYEAYDRDHYRSVTSPDDQDPVAGVSWEEAKAYCAWLGKQSGRPVRLPTEAEWEAACRAGSESEYCFGDDADRLGAFAWSSANSDGRAREVATKRPNAWGLYDMPGNVWEWCEDRHHVSYRLTETLPGPDDQPQSRLLSQAPTDGVAWLFDSDDPDRVFRGGGWNSAPVSCRSAHRVGIDPGFCGDVLGFRPALALSPDR